MIAIKKSQRSNWAVSVRERSWIMIMTQSQPRGSEHEHDPTNLTENQFNKHLHRIFFTAKRGLEYQISLTLGWLFQLQQESTKKITKAAFQSCGSVQALFCNKWSFDWIDVISAILLRCDHREVYFLVISYLTGDVNNQWMLMRSSCLIIHSFQS